MIFDLWFLIPLSSWNLLKDEVREEYEADCDLFVQLVDAEIQVRDYGRSIDRWVKVDKLREVTVVNEIGRVRYFDEMVSEDGWNWESTIDQMGWECSVGKLEQEVL